MAAAAAAAGFGGAGLAAAGAGLGEVGVSTGFWDGESGGGALPEPGGALGAEEPPEPVPATAVAGDDSDALPLGGGSDSATGFLGRAGASPSSGAAWAPSSELIAGFLPAQFGRILNVYHTATPKSVAQATLGARVGA